MTHPRFFSYTWMDGLPKGLEPFQEAKPYYKVISDPYRKRISIEKFNSNGVFSAIVYDSALFDFRHLKPEHQLTWEKECLKESEEAASYLIRDHNGRAIVIEEYLFTKGRCRECFAYYPGGALLSKQKMFYEDFGDALNGVTLYDLEGNPILSKSYLFDQDTEQFTELLSEKWGR